MHVVLLAAINDIDRRLFTDIYEALISLFDSPQSYQEIKKSKRLMLSAPLLIQKSNEIIDTKSD